MKKVALVVMLLATAAFAAPSISITAADGTSSAVVAKGDTIELNLNLINPDQTPVYAADVFLKVNNPGALTVTGRAIGNIPELNGFMTSSAQYRGDAVTAVGGILDPINPKDAGVYNLIGEEQATASGILAKYTFQVMSDTQYPIEIQLFAPVKLWDLDGVLAVGSNAVGSTLFTITPEPASMLLLAAGAAFFARRRRA